MKSKSFRAWLIAVGCLLLGACNYDFPLTDQPTRKIDARLVGDWVAQNKEDNKEELLQVRRLDDSTYVIAMDHDLFRAFHSDFAGTALLSVQNLQPGTDDRKYVYFAWQLSADGDHLSLKGVSNKVVPEDTQTRAAAQRLIKANLANPNLYGDELQFTRKSSR
jgi:hypothetical protein